MIRESKTIARGAVGLAALGLALIAATDPSSARETARNVPALLAEEGRIECRPAIPFFCRNIHISCSGQSAVRTVPFDLTVTGERGKLVFANPDKPDGPDSGPVRIESGYALLRLIPDADYVKVEADGRYSFRIYRRGIALMSHGVCS